MKKYRLIEYDPCGECSVIKQISDDKNVIIDALLDAQRANVSCYYRIEEVEENIIDRVKTYEDACKVLGKQFIEAVNEVKVIAEDDMNIEYVFDLDGCTINRYYALLKLETITEALNEGWKPDWKYREQEKWFIYYAFLKEKCCISYSTCEPAMSSRLYFKSKELAEYAGKQFADLYKQLLIE